MTQAVPDACGPLWVMYTNWLPRGMKRTWETCAPCCVITTSASSNSAAACFQCMPSRKVRANVASSSFLPDAKPANTCSAACAVTGGRGPFCSRVQLLAPAKEAQQTGQLFLQGPLRRVSIWLRAQLPSALVALWLPGMLTSQSGPLG